MTVAGTKHTTPNPSGGAPDPLHSYGISTAPSTLYAFRPFRTGPLFKAWGNGKGSLDIGSADGGMDTAAYLAYTGSSDPVNDFGGVATWYDQAGSADALPDTYLPLLSLGSTIHTIGSKPAMWLRDGQSLIPSFGYLNNAFTLIIAHYSTGAPYQPLITQELNNSHFASLGFNPSGYNDIMDNGYSDAHGSQTISSNTAYITSYTSSGFASPFVVQTYNNGAADPTPLSLSYSGTPFDSNSTIGKASSDRYVGYIGELAYFDTVLSDADRHTVEANMAAWFGITV